MIEEMCIYPSFCIKLVLAIALIWILIELYFLFRDPSNDQDEFDQDEFDDSTFDRMKEK